MCEKSGESIRYLNSFRIYDEFGVHVGVLLGKKSIAGANHNILRTKVQNLFAAQDKNEKICCDDNLMMGVVFVVVVFTAGDTIKFKETIIILFPKGPWKNYSVSHS